MFSRGLSDDVGSLRHMQRTDCPIRKNGTIPPQLCSAKGQISHFEQVLVLLNLVLESETRLCFHNFLSSARYKKFLYHKLSCDFLIDPPV